MLFRILNLTTYLKIIEISLMYPFQNNYLNSTSSNSGESYKRALTNIINSANIDDTSKEKDLGSEKLFERPVDKDCSKSEMVIDVSNTCIKATNEQDCLTEEESNNLTGEKSNSLTGEKSNSSMNNVPNSGNER